MIDRPAVVVFDVNETLFSLEPLRLRLARAGLPGKTLELWFAQTLRDGFALSACGAPRPFLEVAEGTLRMLFARHGLEDTPARIDGVLEGFGDLGPQPDARPALELLRDAGVRAVALTNGSAANLERLLERARFDGLLERVISVDEVGPWKPFPEPYRHAADLCGVGPEQMALVSAHSWDIAGATAVGLTTAWVSRLERKPLSVAPPASVVAEDLLTLVRALASGRARSPELPAPQ